jgi:hypothetical protein
MRGFNQRKVQAQGNSPFPGAVPSCPWIYTFTGGDFGDDAASLKRKVKLWA